MGCLGRRRTEKLPARKMTRDPDSEGVRCQSEPVRVNEVPESSLGDLTIECLDVEVEGVVQVKCRGLTRVADVLGGDLSRNKGSLVSPRVNDTQPLLLCVHRCSRVHGKDTVLEVNWKCY